MIVLVLSIFAVVVSVIGQIILFRNFKLNSLKYSPKFRTVSAFGTTRGFNLLLENENTEPYRIDFVVWVGVEGPIVEQFEGLKSTMTAPKTRTKTGFAREQINIIVPTSVSGSGYLVIMGKNFINKRFKLTTPIIHVKDGLLHSDLQSDYLLRTTRQQKKNIKKAVKR